MEIYDNLFENVSDSPGMAEANEEITAAANTGPAQNLVSLWVLGKVFFILG
jgi:hypothetical protein